MTTNDSLGLKISSRVVKLNA